jgi:hypothetical protein
MAEKKFPLAIVIRAIDEATAPMRKIQGRIDAFTAPIRRLTGGFKALGQEAGLPRVFGALRGVGSAVGGLGSALAGSLVRTTLLAGTASAALFALVKSYTDVGDAVDESAARIGIGVEMLQELRFAAGRGGVEIGTLDGALQQQGKRIAEARQGRGALFTMLERVRPALLEELLLTRDQGKAFKVLVGEMNRTEDAQLRLALANAVWGRSGTQLLVLAEGGVDELERLGARARELGIVLSEEDAKAAGEFDDSLGELMASATGLRNLLGSAVVPVLRDLVDQATRWVVSVRPKVAAFAREFAAGLPEKISALVDWFRRAWEEVQPLIRAGQTLVDKFGAGNVVLGLWAATLGGPVLSAVMALIPAIYSLGAAILTTPIGWLIAGLAAVAAIGIGVWSRWGEIVEFLTFLWDGLVDSIAAAVGWLERFLGLAPIDTGVGASSRRGEASRSAGPAAAAQLFTGGAPAGLSRDDRVLVEFQNVPQGARVTRTRGTAVDLDVGYSMGI